LGMFGRRRRLKIASRVAKQSSMPFGPTVKLLLVRADGADHED
jgi:hypothetical protein